MVRTPHAHNFVRKVQIGLPFRYTLKPMRLDLNTQGGATKGSIATIKEVVVSFLNTLSAKYGKDVNNLGDFHGAGNEFVEGELKTGDLIANLDAGYNVEDDFVISGNDSMPCTIRALVPRKEVTGA